jgi:hypothetical protein
MKKMLLLLSSIFCIMILTGCSKPYNNPVEVEKRLSCEEIALLDYNITEELTCYDFRNVCACTIVNPCTEYEVRNYSTRCLNHKYSWEEEANLTYGRDGMIFQRKE